MLNTLEEQLKILKICEYKTKWLFFLGFGAVATVF